MKKKVLLILIALLCMGSAVYSQDVLIDINGNLEVGTSNPDGRLEVIGEFNRYAIAGSGSGIMGLGVYGENTTTATYGLLGHFDYGVFGYSSVGTGVYGHSSTGNAGFFQGDVRVTGNLIIDGVIAGTTVTHSHSANDITSGTIDESEIDSTITRDSEIMPAILNNDGHGSSMDADTVDGLHASELTATLEAKLNALEAKLNALETAICKDANDGYYSYYGYNAYYSRYTYSYCQNAYSGYYGYYGANFEELEQNNPYNQLYANMNNWLGNLFVN